MEKTEIIIIGLLIVIQFIVFIVVFNKITVYFTFFREKQSRIALICKTIFQKKSFFLPDFFSIKFGDELIELLKTPKSGQYFFEVIKSTNSYLCKNKGVAADFSILKDISERHLEKFENEIGNLINMPLYIGLVGTFIGIIIGLSGIDFSSVAGAVTIDSSSISQLIHGVITAMCASLAGLFFTVINSVFYKTAAYQNDTDKNNYYDLLQRELLPSLNTGFSKTLGTFKDVLNHFIVKFGENMDDYMVSGQLLNENLSKQQFVLEEINKLSLAKTSIIIANLFAKLNESSEHLEKFQNYQKGLNTYIDKTEDVAGEMKSIIEHFKDFSLSLKAIANKTQDSIELQKQFKDSLEKHFPTINDHREVWREQIDELNQDVKQVYGELYKYFAEQTKQIKTFADNNTEFFGEIGEIKKSVEIFVENSNATKEEFSTLQKEIVGLRNDFKETQQKSLETNQAIIEALKEIKKDSQQENLESISALTKAVKSLNTAVGRIGKIEKSKEN
jgi:methyl-accepting chemotaxis protein